MNIKSTHTTCVLFMNIEANRYFFVIHKTKRLQGNSSELNEIELNRMK